MSYERLTAENAAMLFVDHQTGLANCEQTQSPANFQNNVKALVSIAQVYGLPAVIMTSASDGPNGPVMPVVAQGLPNAAIVHRPGEIDAFDNADFAALSAKDAGYDVYAVVDASGTWSKLVEDAAITRMVQAGIVPINWVAVGAELLTRWQSATGEAHAKLMGDHLSFAGNNYAGFLAATGQA